MRHFIARLLVSLAARAAVVLPAAPPPNFVLFLAEMKRRLAEISARDKDAVAND